MWWVSLSGARQKRKYSLSSSDTYIPYRGTYRRCPLSRRLLLTVLPLSFLSNSAGSRFTTIYRWFNPFSFFSSFVLRQVARIKFCCVVATPSLTKAFSAILHFAFFAHSSPLFARTAIYIGWHSAHSGRIHKYSSPSASYGETPIPPNHHLFDIRGRGPRMDKPCRRR